LFGKSYKRLEMGRALLQKEANYSIRPKIEGAFKICPTVKDIFIFLI
jgi:hypothetical protein